MKPESDHSLLTRPAVTECYGGGHQNICSHPWSVLRIALDLCCSLGNTEASLSIFIDPRQNHGKGHVNSSVIWAQSLCGWFIRLYVCC